MTNDETSNMDAVETVLTGEEADALSNSLRALPGITPPREVWERIEQQVEAEGLIRPRREHRTLLKWLAGTGIAAAVALAVLSMPAIERVPPTGAATAASNLPTEPAYDPAADRSPQADISALMVQSRLLERDLRRLPNQPAVGRTATLATIEDIQQRIASIDQQLIESDLSEEDQALYWRERVRLMDSLLRLRYAQAQRVSF